MNATAHDEISYIRRAYRLLFELGRGGMARVYLAESLASGVRKLVVLKILNPELGAYPEMRASFLREAELSAQMNHPNVVQVMEVVEEGDTPVIVMEYLDGVSLSMLLREAGRDLPLPLHLQILSQVLAGLHHFHELRDLDGVLLNVVHRDISPQNVMVLHDGPVKVLDFGIAKINAPDSQVTRTGLVKGKIHYMPPEQLLGESGVDRRADVFAVGVMLWEAVARRRMWQGKSDVELLRCLASGALPELREFASDVPESVLLLVQRATEIDRDQRFATAQEMQQAIDRTLAEQGWFVQPSELAEFMLQHFGEMRREQELKIKSSLRSRSDTDVLLQGTLAGHVPSVPGRRRASEHPTAPTSHWAVSGSFLTTRGKWSWAVVALCCLALALTWTLRRERHPAQLKPQTVAVEVEALPPGSKIFLDGRPLGRDHFVGLQPRTDRKVTLEVSAPGFITEHKQIALRNDIALQIVLEPDPTLAKAAASATSAAGSAVPATISPQPRVHSAKVSLVTPKPSGAPLAKPWGKCNPPYTFSADGIKTYKPECF